MAIASVLNEALSPQLLPRCCEEGQKVQFPRYRLEALGSGRVPSAAQLGSGKARLSLILRSQITCLPGSQMLDVGPEDSVCVCLQGGWTEGVHRSVDSLHCAHLLNMVIP